MNPEARKIHRASGRLERNRPDEVLEILGEDAESNSPAPRSLALAARGLMFEREGNTAEASRCFDRVFAEGVPLRALLRACGRYFKRTGQYDKGYECFSLLSNFHPRAMEEFMGDLPAPERARYSPSIIKRLVGGQRPRFYPLQPLKEALVEQLGAAGAAVTIAESVGLGPGWEVATMPITSLQAYAKAYGLSYEEVVPSSDVILPAPHVVGAPPQAPLHAKSRAVFLCRLADAIVASKSNFLLAGGEALLDHQDDELNRVAMALDVDPIVVAVERQSVTVMIDGRATSSPELERAFALVGVHTYNFGHWLVEFLPKLFACFGRPGFDTIPVLIDEQMHPQHRPALEFFLGPDHPVRVLKPGEAVRVRELWTCSAVTNLGLPPRPGWTGTPEVMAIDGEGFAGLIDSVRPKLEATAGADSPRRIYLRRKDHQHRRLVNREEVEEWFAAHGFSLFDFGDLPFAQQISLVRGADLVVGPDGSALWITFFARAGTRVGILNNPYLEEHWWIEAACRGLGLHLSILIGDVVREVPSYRKFSDYRINVESLPEFLDDLL